MSKVHLARRAANVIIFFPFFSLFHRSEKGFKFQSVCVCVLTKFAVKRKRVGSENLYQRKRKKERHFRHAEKHLAESVLLPKILKHTHTHRDTETPRQNNLRFSFSLSLSHFAHFYQKNIPQQNQSFNGGKSHSIALGLEPTSGSSPQWSSHCCCCWRR